MFKYTKTMKVKYNVNLTHKLLEIRELNKKEEFLHLKKWPRNGYIYIKINIGSVTTKDMQK